MWKYSWLAGILYRISVKLEIALGNHGFNRARIAVQRFSTNVLGLFLD
jgi:hypothetical protein